MKRFLPLFAAITAAISSNSLAAQIKFSDPTNYPISVIIDFPTLTSADLNNDGIEDLTVNSDGSSTIRIFINKGDGTFTTTQSITNIYMPSAITTGDFNNDGLNDIVVSSQEPNYKVINVLLNDKDDPGNFPFDIPYHTGDDPILDLKTIDFNNDGALDLVGVARTDGLYLLQNDGQGAFSVTNTYAAGESAVKVDIGDLDGDSFKDIVVGSQYSRSGDEQDIKILK